MFGCISTVWLEATLVGKFIRNISSCAKRLFAAKAVV
jgi:hypothetical protein